MPRLNRFASYVQETGAVPQIAGNRNRAGNSAAQKKHQLNQLLERVVPRVPHVPLPDDIGIEENGWMALFDERAGIREYDGGLDRAEAERLAYAETVAALGPKPEAR